jgi:hypothetical protein
MTADIQQAPPLPSGASELRLHNEILQNTREVYAGADRLSKLDGTVPRQAAKQEEDRVQRHLRLLTSLLADLAHAANEQDL